MYLKPSENLMLIEEAKKLRPNQTNPPSKITKKLAENKSMGSGIDSMFWIETEE